MHRKKTPLLVTEESIREFKKFSITRRLRWLDEMRDFLKQTLPSEIKKNWGNKN